MYLEDFRTYCLSKPGAEETFPFDNETLVFKVMGKMFALICINKPDYANLKCDPELAIDLRERYAGVTSGWHMNKTHWNSVQLESDYSTAKIEEWIDLSYELVVQSLTKKLKLELQNL